MQSTDVIKKDAASMASFLFTCAKKLMFQESFANRDRHDRQINGVELPINPPK